MSSVDPSSQLTSSDAPAPAEPKMEVKQQDDEDAEDQGEGKASGKMGKGQADIKSEEKPEVSLPVFLRQGCKSKRQC